MAEDGPGYYNVCVTVRVPAVSPEHAMDQILDWMTVVEGAVPSVVSMGDVLDAERVGPYDPYRPPQ